MENIVKKALEIAKIAHHGQHRFGSGTDAVTHPMAVADIIRRETSEMSAKTAELYEAVAMLHDVVEDSPISIAYLEKKGFPAEVLDAVYALTRQEDETYLGYILRIKRDNEGIEKLVKLADLEHNMSDLRKGSLKDKYMMATYILKDKKKEPKVYRICGDDTNIREPIMDMNKEELLDYLIGEGLITYITHKGD